MILLDFFFLSGLNLLQERCIFYSFQMWLGWRAGMPISPYHNVAKKPFRDPTAFGMESKCLSLDSGQPFAHLSISEQTFGHAYLLPSLMLSPLPGIPTLLSFPLLPNMSHSKPICKLLFIPQGSAQVASGTFFCLSWSFSVLLKIFLNVW